MTAANRNARIKAMVEKGIPLTEIGRQFHISGTRVAQIRDGKRGGGHKVASKEVTSTHSPNGTPPLASNDDTEVQVAYIYGRIESQLEVYSSVSGIPLPELALRLSELLRGKASGKVFRPTYRMSSVR